jgi:hypothetical protein
MSRRQKNLFVNDEAEGSGSGHSDDDDGTMDSQMDRYSQEPSSQDFSERNNSSVHRALLNEHRSAVDLVEERSLNSLLRKRGSETTTTNHYGTGTSQDDVDPFIRDENQDDTQIPLNYEDDDPVENLPPSEAAHFRSEQYPAFRMTAPLYAEYIKKFTSIYFTAKRSNQPVPESVRDGALFKKMLHILKRIWIEDCRNVFINQGKVLAFGLKTFGFPNMTALQLPTIDNVNKQYRMLIHTTQELKTVMEDMNLCWKCGSELIEAEARQARDAFGHIIRSIHVTYESLTSFIGHAMVLGNDVDNSKLSKAEERFFDMNVSTEFADAVKLGDYQNLLIFVLEKIAKEGLRKYRDTAWKEIVFKDNTGVLHATHAWTHCADISQIVDRLINRSKNFNMWLKLTTNMGFYNSVIRFITDTTDDSFPVLTPCRGVYSFFNGVYNTETNEFLHYGNAQLTADIVSCKFFEANFDDELLKRVGNDWESIETPYFESIFTFQEIPKEVIKWVYTMAGRMLYAAGKMDDWQTALFVKGQAGTGKSTLLTIIKEFFQESDVGVLSNNIEKKFGLEPLCTKMALFCFEVKNNFGLDQSDLQSIISAEDMNIPRKNKVPISIKWEVPIMFAGNEMGPWIDASGSMSRRFLIIEFPKRVINSDNDLKQKIKKEIPHLIMKCNTAYQMAVNTYGAKGIWSPNVLPDYFRNTQNNMRRTTNSIIAFLEDRTELDRGVGKFMPFSVFAAQYNAFCKKFMMRGISLSDENMEGPFTSNTDYPIVKQDDSQMWEDTLYKGSFIFGCAPTTTALASAK